jgi:vacuolar-type H+-ATPase subunit E/Vma4
MALSDITQKIKSDAEEQASLIAKEAEIAVEEIAKEVEGKKEELTALHEEKVARRLKRNEEHIRQSAKRVGKQEVEAAKRAALNSAFEAAYEALVSLPEAKYEDMLTKLLRDVDATDDVVVHAPENRLAETNAACKSAGLKAEIVADTSLEGGVIVLGKGFEYDLSFKKLMENKRDNLEIDVANILFA